MKTPTPLERALAIATRSGIARACGVTYAAIYKWERANRLPQSDHVGLTTHARNIARACGGQVAEGELLEWSRANWHRAERAV
jgi:hypothetical protein